jgi:tetratricopeptide (TPR) repeat protein
MRAMEGAVLGAAEAGHAREQVHFLCLSAKLLREWKTRAAKQDFAHAALKAATGLPDDEQAKIVGKISQRMEEASDAIEAVVRRDDQVRELLGEAKEIAKRERLPEALANCVVDEAHNMTEQDDEDGRRKLLGEAIELLTEALKAAEAPKRRGNLMGRISALHRQCGKDGEAIVWLKRAGGIFEKHGDVFGLANFYGSLAELHRADGRLDDEIEAYRKVLTLIEGRSFHHLAAGVRINLAAALRFRRDLAEAQKLLDEAEALCERHQFKDFISAIARNRSEIETELQAAQASRHSLAEILESLGELLRYRPEDAPSYLLFWYFAWQTELMALMRSGPRVSLMVVTDEVNEFLRFTERFRGLADHFLLTTSRDFGVKVEPRILAILPTWRSR